MKEIAAQVDTLIVGAGLAGLVVAHRLRQAGLAVTVVEARDRPGGRVQSIPQALGTAIAAELGGEAFDSDHVAALTLARQLGLPVVDLTTQALSAQDQALAWFGGELLPMDSLLVEWRDRLLAHAEDWQALTQCLTTGSLTPALVHLDRLSIPAYLDRLGCSAPLKALVSTAYGIKYGMEAEAQSCLNVLWFFRTAAHCETLFGRGDERFYIQGGNEQLPQALAASLGDCLHLETALVAVEPGDPGYRVTLRQGGQDQPDQLVTCDRLVLALPFSVLRHLNLAVDLPEPQRQAIAHLPYNTPTKVITAHPDKPWQSQAPQGMVYSDRPVAHCWEASDSLLTPGPGLLVAYPGGAPGLAVSKAPLETATQSVLEDLRPLFPGLAPTAPSLRSPWLTDPHSRGAYAYYGPGDWGRFWGWEGVRSGRLWFAGEHCSRRYQGYMEGACETAEQVALEILQDAASPAATAHRDYLTTLEAQRLGH